MSQAERYNQGKPQYSLLDLTALEPGTRVLEFGAKKYARDNWKKGMPVTQILDSLLRHLAALRSGELIDPESGLPHIGHIQCNAMFLGNPNNTQDVTLDITDCDLKGKEDFYKQLDLALGVMDQDKEVLSILTDNMIQQIDEDDNAAMGIRPPTEEDGVIHLGPEATKKLLDALDNPPEPNENLKKLFKKKKLLTGLCPHDVSKYKEYLDDETT